MQYAISHDGKSYADYPYFDSEEQAYKEGRDMMWEAGATRLYIAKVVEVKLLFPFSCGSVTEAIAQIVEEKYEGLGRDWFSFLLEEHEDALKSHLDAAVADWAIECGVNVTEDAYEEIGNYNLEVI